jgi:hypothetical protein
MNSTNKKDSATNENVQIVQRISDAEMADFSFTSASANNYVLLQSQMLIGKTLLK